MGAVKGVKGGDRLERRLADLIKNASKASKVSVGFFADKTYADTGTSVAMVAALNEFGSERSPPRPFFRGMISDKSAEWPGAIAELLKANDYDAAKTLGQAGEAIAGQLKQSIADFSGAPLSEKTIARKGSYKQLVDTGTMLDSPGSKVE